METALLVLILAAVGGIAAVLLLSRGRTSALDEDQFAQIAERVRAELAATQSQALRENSDQFLALAETRLKAETARGEEQLKARGSEIEKGLESVGGAISKLREYVESTDKARGDSVTSLATLTTESRKTMEALSAATGELAKVLVSGQARGAWGERMAEDILRAAGFAEETQYRKNKQIEGGSTRPDFTFLLPQNRLLHMDVKFPLDAYLRFVRADSDTARAVATQEFIRDAKKRIKEVTGRDYIDTAGGTLDYVLLFVPNEQVYGFIHESDPTLLDGALQQHVVMCSPFTLFAVLAVVRQAMDNFHLTQRTDEILRALGGFSAQWIKYRDVTDKVGKQIGLAQKAFDEMAGVRTRVLERQLDRVDQLRKDAGLQIAPPPGFDELQLDDESPEDAGAITPVPVAVRQP